MDSGNFVDRNFLGRLEHVSSAASGSELSFREVIESGSDVEEIASFLGISPVQAFFFLFYRTESPEDSHPRDIVETSQVQCPETYQLYE